MNRFPNSLISAASAEIPVHRLRDLLVAGIRCFRKKRGRRHDLSGLAVAALRNFFGNPRFLQNVQTISPSPSMVVMFFRKLAKPASSTSARVILLREPCRRHTGRRRSRISFL